MIRSEEIKIKKGGGSGWVFYIGRGEQCPSAHANADAKLFLGVFLSVLGRWVMMAAQNSMTAIRNDDQHFLTHSPALSPLCSNAMCEHHLSTAKHIQTHHHSSHPLTHAPTHRSSNHSHIMPQWKRKRKKKKHTRIGENSLTSMHSDPICACPFPWMCSVLMSMQEDPGHRQVNSKCWRNDSLHSLSPWWLPCESTFLAIFFFFLTYLCAYPCLLKTKRKRSRVLP